METNTSYHFAPPSDAAVALVSADGNGQSAHEPGRLVLPSERKHRILPGRYEGLRVGFLSSYPPRECGIATFTKDLVDALDAAGLARPYVAALNDSPNFYRYDGRVVLQIDHPNLKNYLAAAWALNISPIDVISVQHEFGILGGWEDEPDQLIPFLQELHKPVVTTLHTVLPHPIPHIRGLIRGIAEHSSLVTTMVHLGANILEEDYGLPADKIVVIPHGIPDTPPVPTEVAKRKLGLQGWKVLSTFGLINRGKGLEYALRAIPDIVKEHPDVQYLVLGETHPVVRLREGESYRNSLVTLVHKLGVEDHVHFVNRYLTKHELLAYLQATDVYITPYLNRDQIASGTLAYAVGLGKACVSTPYLYAQEMLGEGRGMLAQFKSARSLARCVRQYLEHPSLRAHAEKSTRQYGQRTTWPRVAESFVETFGLALKRATAIPTAV